MNKEHVQYIIIHHWGSPKATIEDVKRHHVDELGFRAIGAHYLIGNGQGINDGEIVEGRPVTMGSCQNRGFNSKSLSILLIGDFDRYFVSKKQWNSLVGLVKKLMEIYGIPADNVLGHRELFSLRGMEAEKTCPGVKICCDKLRRELYDGDSEIFSDGSRRNFIPHLCIDDIVVPEVSLEYRNSEFYLRVSDIEKIFDVTVEYIPKMRIFEIRKK